MCGFTGVASFNTIYEDIVRDANKFSICRGPDNLSFFKDSKDINLFLAFNRLAIIDLSNKANQPMKSTYSDAILMFNGEIYNSLELRERLLKNKYKFETESSDTETLLAGLEIYGLDFVKELEGQFAFVYINRNLKKIYLVRDRLGQKPLFYFMTKTSLGFASNLKSLISYFKEKQIDVNELNQYLLHGINYDEKTIFKNYLKVKPSSILEISYEQNNFVTNEIKYWDTCSYIDKKSFDQSEFIELFSSAVKKRMFSDVPVANFLSGGIDSTSIVKNMHDQNLEINTFSVIVAENSLNEEKFINQVVKKYKTNHESVVVDNSISKNIILDSLESLDEPFADPSIVPTFYLSKAISSKYKVAISGDGGDELLGGYERMKNHLLSKNNIQHIFSKLFTLYPSILGTGTNLKKYSKNLEISYLGYLEDEKLIDLLKINSKNDLKKLELDQNINFYKSVLKNEIDLYLSCQMLLKIDRASMANSLEIRSPLVDHKLIEYVLSHSHEYLDRNNQKKPLQDYLKIDFNEEFINRPKQGFVFDYKFWVYENLFWLEEEIKDLLINENKVLSYKSLNILKINKTRINALRIWKLFVLSNYLKLIRNL